MSAAQKGSAASEDVEVEKVAAKHLGLKGSLYHILEGAP